MAYEKTIQGNVKRGHEKFHAVARRVNECQTNAKKRDSECERIRERALT
jgi:hypothetical protein